MTILIILIALLTIGGYLTTTWNYDVIGILMCFFFGMLLVIHVISWSCASHEYDKFVMKKNEIEHALSNHNECENMLIVRDALHWNIDLREYKLSNKMFVFNNAIDDRIETLTPINIKEYE